MKTKRVKVIEKQWGGFTSDFFGYIPSGKTKKKTISFDEYIKFTK